MNATVPGRVIVLCGLPGSGKTTTGQRLAGELGVIRMCPDEWMAALDIDVWDQGARARIEGFQRGWTIELTAAGYTVAIEWGLWSRAERDAVRDAVRAAGAAVELRFLDVPLDELIRRVQERDSERYRGGRSITSDEMAEWFAAFEPPTPAELATYDPPS